MVNCLIVNLKGQFSSIALNLYLKQVSAGKKKQQKAAPITHQ